MLQNRLGSWQAYLLTLKEQFLTYLNNNSIIGVPLYKFAQGLGVFLIFLLLRRLFTFIVLRSVRKFVSFTKTSLDDNLIQIFEGPLKFTFIIIGLYFALKIAGITNATSAKIMRSLIIFVVFWVIFNAVHVLDEVVYGFARKFGKELYREIGAFFIKTLKIFIFAVGLVSILQEWNINVSAFLASLGLGGLAFALAAKDTASNLFGGLSILADRALKIDDWIKVGDVEGTVEEIGLRTTKIRTFEKSLVTVPNQIIANNPIENFSRRSVRRIKMRIGLVYSTSREQMKAIVRDIRKMLQHHPNISKKATLLVNFDQFNDSDLSIFIYCFTNTANWAKYLSIREDINLKIMEIVERHGSDFAFPSESIYVEKFPFESPTSSSPKESNKQAKPNLPKEDKR
ncbi:MAG: mechanosensitive ion channel family protein [Epsilonproteobacteria bacterium]|nr:mechanosensitive ion channel family protein [Campylobacterota bacterium]